MKNPKNIDVSLLIPLILLGVNFCVFWDFSLDDAYISFRYAANWIKGWGLVYNYGERVEGYTNFLWTILIGGLMRLGSDPLLASRIIGVALGFITLIFVYRLTHLFVSEDICFNAIPALILATNVCFAAYCVSGMETPLFTLLITLAGYRTIVELQSSKCFPFSAILFSLATLTRPEGLLIFGVSWVFSLGARLYHRQPIRPIVVSMALFSIIFIPYYLWRYLYYGYPFPNTYYAKVGFSVTQALRGLRYILRFFTWFFGGTLLFIPPTIYLLFRRKLIGIYYLAAISTVYVFYVLFIGGDGNPLFRFMLPILPLVVVLVGTGLSAIWQDLTLRPVFVSLALIRNRPLILLVWGCCAMITLAAASHYKGLADATSALVERKIEQGLWLRANANIGDTLATPTAGALPYYSQLYTYDMLGLTDEHIAHTFIPSMGSFYLAGHEKNDPEYIFSKRPTWLWIATDPQAQWIPGTKELVNLPGFAEAYEPYRVSLSNGVSLEIFHLKSDH